MTPAAAAKALLLGLSAGPYCSLFCLSAVAPVLLGGSDRAGHTLWRLALFVAGRLAGYLCFGLIAGLAGSALARFHLFRAVGLPVLNIALGLLVLAYGLVQSFPRAGLCRLFLPRLESGWYVLLLGLATGLTLCPPFLLAGTAAAELGRPLAAVLFFLVFSAGTLVWLLPLLLAGLARRFGPVRVAGRVLCVLSGLWFIWLGTAALVATTRA